MPEGKPMARPCAHPHRTASDSAWLLDIPTTPQPPGQVILCSEVGLVPYAGFDTYRGCAAAGNLIRRHLDAGTIVDGMLVPDSVRALADGSPVPRYEDRQYAIPQMVLSAALAEAEGRLCVADWCRQQLVSMSRIGRTTP